MAGKSRGRGLTAAVGWLLLCAGIVGAISLVVVGQRRFDDTVSTFARARVGCVTTLRFTEPGTFFVFEETGQAPVSTSGGDDIAGQCTPTADVSREFAFSLTAGEGPVGTVRERSISYEQDGRSGQSSATFLVTAPVTVDIVVVGPDDNVVAAVGRNPHEARDDMRRLAVVLGVAGLVLGLLLLVLSGRRSRRANVATLPDGPGWSRPIPPAPPVMWPPSGPSISGAVQPSTQRPINPHMPDHPVGDPSTAGPWPSPTQGLFLPPVAEALPRRMAPPPTDAATRPDSATDAGPTVGSEASHHRDDTPED